MVFREQSLSFSVTSPAQSVYQLHIAVPGSFVQAIYRYTLEQHQQSITTHGFSRGTTPLSYLESTYKVPILEQLKEFFFNHCILNSLLNNIMEHRPLICGEPELIDITIDPQNGAQYIFKALQAHPEVKQEWKRTNFKAPQRKNYKDLDRQVELFLQEETAKSTDLANTITVGDWVCFNLTVLDIKEQELLPGHRNSLWIRMSDEETDKESYSLFEGHQKGDFFATKSRFLQQYISPRQENTHLFGIEIVDISSSNCFSFDLFKRHFKIKQAKDLHHKLIEVFSYRNDISQRRESAEAAMRILREQHSVTIPEFLIDRQEDLVLEQVHYNPDYHVYKAQPEFKKYIRQLAEKQLRESILIDHVARQESVVADHEDVMGYFNLLKRPRMKEFIYFTIPMQKAGGQEYPIPYEVVRYCSLREKTLNHVLHYLTKR